MDLTLRPVFLSKILLFGFMWVGQLPAQDWLTVGVKGGIPLTDPFADRTHSYVLQFIPNPFAFQAITDQIHTYSGPRGFVLGPTVEVRLPLGLAVEADGLYRPLNYRSQTTTILQLVTSPGPTLKGRFDLWEFPILAKYRFSLPLVKPYVSAGPTFRAVSGLVTQHMSTKGVAAAVGIETHIGRLQISPEIRYTHWGSDGSYNTPYYFLSHPNQLELLAGLSAGPSAGTNNRPATGMGGTTGWREYFSFGVKGGTPFSSTFRKDEFQTIRCGNFSATAACTPLIETVQTQRASRQYQVGPAVAVRLPLGLSVETDALYSPISGPYFSSLGDFLLGTIVSGYQTYTSWQFPVVAKYTFRAAILQPYIEGGPTFRTAPSAGRYLSKIGITAGIGVETKLWQLHLAPEVRFVRWGNDAGDADTTYASHRNQGQFLVGLWY